MAWPNAKPGKCQANVTNLAPAKWHDAHADEDKSGANDICAKYLTKYLTKDIRDHFAEAVSGAYWPQKGVMAAKEDDINEDIPETIKGQTNILWMPNKGLKTS